MIFSFSDPVLTSHIPRHEKFPVWFRGQRNVHHVILACSVSSDLYYIKKCFFILLLLFCSAFGIHSALTCCLHIALPSQEKSDVSQPHSSPSVYTTFPPAHTSHLHNVHQAFPPLDPRHHPHPMPSTHHRNPRKPQMKGLDLHLRHQRWYAPNPPDTTTPSLYPMVNASPSHQAATPTTAT